MARQSAVAVAAKDTASHENSQSAAINKTMQLVTPTSVSTGSIGPYGAVAFSGASAISINGVFTPEFDNYLIVFDLTTSGVSAPQITLRLAGTDSTAGYDNERCQTINATVTASQSLNAAFWYGTTIGLAGGTQVGSLMVFSPALAVATRSQVQTSSTANPMTTSSGTYTGGMLHRSTTAYDGFTFTPSTGTITGSIRVFGII